MEKLKVLHIITNLEAHGAQMMLFHLLSRHQQMGVESSVISLSGQGPLTGKIQALGIPVLPLLMDSQRPNPGSILRLVWAVVKQQPHILQTWMYHADLLGGIAGIIAGWKTIVWGIHHTTLGTIDKHRTRAIVRLCSRLSPVIPEQIICCSQSALAAHQELGYPARKMVVIPNGFDFDLYHPDENLRITTRRNLGIREDDFVIGMVARFHPQKDHATFAAAAAQIQQRYPRVHFLLCGTGIDSSNRELVAILDQAKIRERCLLLGQQEAMLPILNVLDLHVVSASHGEAFPLVIGEAMSCGVPCVVTDVGDSARMVGNTGSVVPPSNPLALALACLDWMDRPDAERIEAGKLARERIISQFSLESTARHYMRVYSDLMA